MMFLNPVNALSCAQEVEQLAADGNLEASRKKLDELQSHVEAVCNNLESYLARAQD